MSRQATSTGPVRGTALAAALAMALAGCGGGSSTPTAGSSALPGAGTTVPTGGGHRTGTGRVRDSAGTAGSSTTVRAQAREHLIRTVEIKPRTTTVAQLVACLHHAGQPVDFRTEQPRAPENPVRLVPAGAYSYQTAVTVMLFSRGATGAIATDAPAGSIVTMYTSPIQATAALHQVQSGVGGSVHIVSEGDAVLLGSPSSAERTCTG